MKIPICKFQYFAFALTVTLLVMPQTANAYLDPGTGSMLLQGLIALIGGTLGTVGVYWRSLRGSLQKLLHRKPDVKSDRGNDL